VPDSPSQLISLQRCVVALTACDTGRCLLRRLRRTARAITGEELADSFDPARRCTIIYRLLTRSPSPSRMNTPTSAPC